MDLLPFPFPRQWAATALPNGEHFSRPASTVRGRSSLCFLSSRRPLPATLMIVPGPGVAPRWEAGLTPMLHETPAMMMLPPAFSTAAGLTARRVARPLRPHAPPPSIIHAGLLPQLILAVVLVN